MYQIYNTTKNQSGGDAEALSSPHNIQGESIASQKGLRPPDDDMLDRKLPSVTYTKKNPTETTRSKVKTQIDPTNSKTTNDKKKKQTKKKRWQTETQTNYAVVEQSLLTSQSNEGPKAVTAAIKKEELMISDDIVHSPSSISKKTKKTTHGLEDSKFPTRYNKKKKRLANKAAAITKEHNDGPKLKINDDIVQPPSIRDKEDESDGPGAHSVGGSGDDISRPNRSNQRGSNSNSRLSSRVAAPTQPEVTHQMDGSIDLEDGTQSAVTPNAQDSDALIAATLVDNTTIDRDQEEALTRRIMQKFVTAEAVETVPNNKRKLLFTGGGGVICGLVIIGIVLTVVLVSNNEPEESLSPTIAPTIAPTNAPTITPTPLSDEVFLQNLLLPLSGESLLDGESPANKAFQWLLKEDPAKLDFQNSDEGILVDRFGLAVLYYATNGTEWFDQMNFLSSSSVCDWNSLKNQTTLLTHQIECNAEGRLRRLLIDYNHLKGTLPPELSGLEFLDYLSLEANELVGSIPEEYGELLHLEELILDGNMLTGTIPTEISKLSKLEELFLHSNLLQGTIPDDLAKLPQLERLYLARNVLDGPIPEFGNRITIRKLALSDNLLTGEIPLSLFVLNDLDVLYLHSNELSGGIPSDIGTMSSLTALDLSSNGFGGAIPTEITNLWNLEVLNLGSNNLSGTLPSTLLGWSQKLKVLMLGNNLLTGTLATELGVLSSMFHLDVKSNRFHGTIPSELALLPDLEVIRLQGNSLVGDLGDTLCTIDSAYLIVEADCGASEVKCPCCSTCCDDISGTCISDPNGVCEKFGSWVSWECRCEEASESNVQMICDEGHCFSCNADRTTCVINQDIGYTFDEFGLLAGWHAEIRYINTQGRDETISWATSYGDFKCTVAINGEECRTCQQYYLCPDGSTVHLIDCENVEGAGFYEGCSDYDGGVFDALKMYDSGTYQNNCAPAFW